MYERKSFGLGVAKRGGSLFSIGLHCHVVMRRYCTMPFRFTRIAYDKQGGGRKKEIKKKKKKREKFHGTFCKTLNHYTCTVLVMYSR